LIDPKDVERQHRSAGIPVSAAKRRKKRTVHSILRRLFRLAYKGGAEAAGTVTRPSTVYDAAEEMERNRRSRQQFLESRKARGSIMYEKGGPDSLERRSQLNCPLRRYWHRADTAVRCPCYSGGLLGAGIVVVRTESAAAASQYQQSASEHRRKQDGSGSQSFSDDRSGRNDIGSQEGERIRERKCSLLCFRTRAAQGTSITLRVVACVTSCISSCWDFVVAVS
jgi:hypothetical protein